MKKLLSITLFLFTYSLAFSQVAYNQEFHVDSLHQHSSRPSIAGLINGGFIVCWQATGPNGSREIFAQLYDEHRIKVGNEFQVNTFTNYNQLKPSVAASSNGGFIICWESQNQDGSGDGIFAQLFDNDGIKLGNEFRVNTHTINYQDFPRISGLTNGGYVICWRSPLDGSDRGIYAQMYDDIGIRVGDEFRVNTFTNNIQTYPSVSNLFNGGYVISWASLEQDGSGYGIYAQIYNDSGIKVGNEFQVNTFTNDNQFAPSVCDLKNGKFIISWESEGQDGNGYGIYAQIYDDSGIKVGTEFKVNDFTNFDQENPSVSGLSNGGFVVCWESDYQDGQLSGIFGQIYNHLGKKLGSEFRMNAFTIGAQLAPTSCALINGGFVVCWWYPYRIAGKYYLDEPINHNLIRFKLLEPQLDLTINPDYPWFKWESTTETRINFDWELTYDLFLDNDSNFISPMITRNITDTIYNDESLASYQTYYWKVLASNFTGDSLWSSDIFGFYTDPNVTGIKEIGVPIPNYFSLFQNHPNPFNPSTKNKFTVPAKVKGEMSNVILIVYDILGNEIATLVKEQKPPGTYEVEFDGKGLTSGIYFYKLSVGKYSVTRKMLLIK